MSPEAAADLEIATALSLRYQNLYDKLVDLVVSSAELSQSMGHRTMNDGDFLTRLVGAWIERWEAKTGSKMSLSHVVADLGFSMGLLDGVLRRIAGGYYDSRGENHGVN